MREKKRNSREDNSGKPVSGRAVGNRSVGSKSAGSRPVGRDREEGSKPVGSRSVGRDREEGGKPVGSRSAGKRPVGRDRAEGSRPAGDRPVGSRPVGRDRAEGSRPAGDRPAGRGYKAESKGRAYTKKDSFSSSDSRKRGKDDSGRPQDIRPFRKREEDSYKNKKHGTRERIPVAERKTNTVDDGKIRLNRFIANSGICSRRKADELIEAGVISVNGETVSELGFKVDPAKDQVRYNGELLKREKKVYVLLNKPKDYITTTDDPQERRTVMQLVEKASRERIYPVGRLDRNTTGLLLMTNDGDLADKLSHPKNGITKIYQVELNRNLTQGDFNKIEFGLELEDGIIKPDSISYVAGGSKKEIGIQIHSGKNRIVRRIFEHLGYDVVKLDRVVYGNLTKKDLPRGRWRYLEDHELIQIKHLIK